MLTIQAGYAQCYQLGTVGQMTPVLKTILAGVCTNPAQPSSVCDCPPGYVAVGYEGEEGNAWGGMVLSQFKLRCKQLNSNGTLGATVVVTCSNGTATGATVDGPIDAAAGQALVGAQIRIGCATDAVYGYSKPITDIIAGGANTTNTAMVNIGGTGGSAQPPMYAPNGNVIVGMQTYIDAGTGVTNVPNGTVGVAWRYAPIVACASAVPTMSEWGLILFALIIFTFTVVFATQQQRARSLALAGEGAVSNTRRQRIPFNKAVYLKVLPLVYLGFVSFFAIATAFFGYEITSADIPGSLLSGAVIAYLVHFVISSNNTDNH
ncbi:MAG: IPTL-CTERM sorting domain-containing protein [Bacteroidetes bacterium]|nr:IPTL-CTERM sorting domain-containing protein [Bacteroidota bacterium]